MMKGKRQVAKGFTLLELLVVVGILIILAGIIISNIGFFREESQLNNLAGEVINILRLAQNKTLASEQASSWGVYFSTTTDPHQYTLFKGGNYASRDTSFDEIRKLPKAIIISEIDLADGGSEVVFDRIVGTTKQPGSITLELKTDSAKNKVIHIEGSGQVGLTFPLIPSDENRLKDSRHIHIDYTRFISTSTEKLILTFEGGIIETIIIKDYTKDDQIYWEKEVNVGGEIQKLKIHTHRLNDPDTLFCIYRDRRFNNKSLSITISGDTSGTLIEYSADGLIIIKTSIYASDPIWQ